MELQAAHGGQTTHAFGQSSDVYSVQITCSFLGKHAATRHSIIMINNILNFIFLCKTKMDLKFCILENFLFSCSFILSMEKITEKEAIALLQKYSSSKKAFDIVLAHSRIVQKVALGIAKKIPCVDLNFIKTSALLHDIGRFKCPPHKNSIRHGLEGAKILRKEGLSKYALVAERHIGVGITKQDIKQQKLKLPLKDYVPKTIEEKIISYADNVVFGTTKKTFQDVITRYRKEVGEFIVPRIIQQHNEILSLSTKT